MGGSDNSNSIDFEKLSWRYLRQGVAMTMGLFIAGLAASVIWRLDFILVPLIVGAGFAVVIDLADSVV